MIVECHPAMVLQARRLLQFQGLLAGKLEVAMGLETADPDVLRRLNKRTTLEQFRQAADFLREHDAALRVFIMVRPPWTTEREGLEWACRSLDFAFDCGAETCSLIPTRGGNGAMEALAARGEWSPPSLRSLEVALEYGLSLGRGRVFADLWDLAAIPACPECLPVRTERLRQMNETQRVPEPVRCGCEE